MGSKSSLKYVSHPVWSGQYHTVGRHSALGFSVFVFASDLQDALLLQLASDIKAIWLTHSDLFPMASACARTVRRHDLQSDCSALKGTAFFFLFSQASNEEATRKPNSCLGYDGGALISSTRLVLTLP